ncbi:hypothetical protein HKX48_001728 [Thoreauomyces humboldtii]|nr:hypothetical protein HKX48_001728 [Thoreauomyces humboldtii]
MPPKGKEKVTSPATTGGSGAEVTPQQSADAVKLLQVAFAQQQKKHGSRWKGQVDKERGAWAQTRDGCCACCGASETTRWRTGWIHGKVKTATRVACHSCHRKGPGFWGSVSEKDVGLGELAKEGAGLSLSSLIVGRPQAEEAEEDDDGAPGPSERPRRAAAAAATAAIARTESEWRQSKSPLRAASVDEAEDDAETLGEVLNDYSLHLPTETRAALTGIYLRTRARADAGRQRLQDEKEWGGEDEPEESPPPESEGSGDTIGDLDPMEMETSEDDSEANDSGNDDDGEAGAPQPPEDACWWRT